MGYRICDGGRCRSLGGFSQAQWRLVGPVDDFDVNVRYFLEARYRV
jgi:hypothetical protein